jgi:hypothetical protein
MVAKKVVLGCDLTFSSIKEAKNFFDPIRTNGQLDSPISSKDFEQVKALYDAYCAATNWPMPSPAVAFFPTEVTKNGGTTICFGIEFADGRKDNFSLDKALSAVAK